MSSSLIHVYTSTSCSIIRSSNTLDMSCFMGVLITSSLITHVSWLPYTAAVQLINQLHPPWFTSYSSASQPLLLPYLQPFCKVFCQWVIMLLSCHLTHAPSVQCLKMPDIGSSEPSRCSSCSRYAARWPAQNNPSQLLGFRSLWISNSIEVAHASDRPAHHMHTPSNRAALHMLSNWVGYNGYMLIHTRTDLAALLPFTTGEQRKNNATPMHLPLIWGEDVLSPVIMAVFMAELPQHSSQSAVCLVCTNTGWAT